MKGLINKRFKDTSLVSFFCQKVKGFSLTFTDQWRIIDLVVKSYSQGGYYYEY